ncbi:hypothetical protein [Labrys neptuniae]
MIEAIVDQFTADLRTLAWLITLLVAGSLTTLVVYRILRRR